MVAQTENVEINQDALEDIKELAKKSLYFFAYGILRFEDLDPYIHRPICDKIQDYEKNPRSLVVLPRDWFKSSIGSIAYPIFRAIQNPNIRILIVQNSHSNACKKLNSIKQIFEKNKLLRVLFPEVLPDVTCTWSKECLMLNRTAPHPEGTFEAAGVGTATTSRHYDLIIEDDTISPGKDSMTGILQMPTKLEIEKAIGWHRQAYPLLLHPTRSQRLVIGTRWAERDLIGWIIENAPEYKLLSRSAREINEKTKQLEPIWHRYTNDVLDQIERDVGTYMFSTLFMNMPIASINQVFQRDWIQYYDTVPEMHKCAVCTSVDPAASDMDSSSDPDYNIVLTTKVNSETGKVYILEYSRARMNPGELIQEILRHQATYNPTVVKIESIAYQRTLSFWLKKKQENLGQYFWVDEVKSHGKTSKEDRIRALQPFYGAGQIFQAAYMGDLERELLSFPSGAHDDIIDALAMQVGFWVDETRVIRQEEEKSVLKDPFSGATIIDELLQRADKSHQYPYDIGIMAERLSQPKAYQYEGSYI